MDKQTISFRMDAEKVDALDTLAESLERDRSYLLNQAVDAYLDVQKWQIEQIQKGRREAEAGKLLDHATVRRMAHRWRKK